MKRYKDRCEKIYKELCDLYYRKDKSIIQDKKASIIVSIREIIWGNSNELRYRISRVLEFSNECFLQYNYNDN